MLNSSRHRFDQRINFGGDFFASRSQLVVFLQIQPQLCRCAKAARQSQRGVGGDRTLAFEYGRDPIGRNMQHIRQRIRAEFVRHHEFRFQIFSWVSDRQPLARVREDGGEISFLQVLYAYAHNHSFWRLNGNQPLQHRARDPPQSENKYAIGR